MTSDTTNSTSVEQFLSGKLAQVDVAAIERELKQLWTSVAEGEAERASVARACVLNLVLYSCDMDAEISSGNLLDEISLQHPCRALLAIARPSEDLRLEAWVSARCHLTSAASHKQICCEQITVRWEGNGVQELPSVIVPLLVPDLPVFLWWRTATLATAAIDPFIKAIDRLVLDSARWGNQLQSFNTMDLYIRHHAERLTVSDLNWRRLLEWRKAFARSFDELILGLGLSDLETIESITIDYLGNSIYQPLLLLGWMASELGWEPESAKAEPISNACLEFKCRQRTIKAQWHGLPGAIDNHVELQSMRIEMTGGRTLSFTLQKQDGCLLVASTIGETIKEVIVNGPLQDESTLIGRELEVLERDPVFEKSVQVASKIITLF